MNLAKEMKQVARLAARFAGEDWQVIGDEVYSGERRIGRLRDGLTAEFVTRLHNLYLPLYNRILLLLKKQRDEEKSKEIEVERASTDY